MFQLDFFKIVKIICDNGSWKNIYVNPHDAAVMKKKDNPNSERPQNRELCEYIQYTYPTYFGFQLHLPHAMVKNRNRLTKEQQRLFFFE
jgi:hypothetical protein